MLASRRPLVLTLMIALLVSAGAATAQQDLSQVEITTKSLSPNLAMLVGRGGNLAVSYGEDGTFLIDDQYAPLTKKITEAVGSLTKEPIRFVLNTHWHGDHTGGNENLGKAGALIVAHDNVRARMSIDQFIEAFNSEVPAAPKVALPVVTFDETITFHLNGEEIHAFHIPAAHTDGDSLVHFKTSNVLHMGDTFFNGIFPFIDVGSGGSVDGMIRAANAALAVVDDATQIVPGHGPLANRDDLIAFRDMLETVRRAIKPLVAAGKSLEEVSAAKPLAALEADWGGGFLNMERFVAIAYSSYAK